MDNWAAWFPNRTEVIRNHNLHKFRSHLYVKQTLVLASCPSCWTRYREIPWAVCRTTRSFILLYPAPIGPLSPAVPNSRRVLRKLRSSVMLFVPTYEATCALVSSFGSHLIYSAPRLKISASDSIVTAAAIVEHCNRVMQFPSARNERVIKCWWRLKVSSCHLGRFWRKF